MERPLSKQSFGPVDDALRSYYDTLCNDAAGLVRSSGSILKMSDEADRILQQTNSPESLPIPSVSLLLAAGARLRALLRAARDAARDAGTVEALARVVALYALATAPGISVGDATSAPPSRGSGGRTTATGRRHERPPPNSSSSNGGAAPAAPSGATGVGQVAEEMYCAASDAVVACAAGGGWPAETRLASLCAFAAALARFGDTPLNATRHLPVLFPEVDATRGPPGVPGEGGLPPRGAAGGGGGGGGGGHPLLTPLLWDDDARVRSAAAAAIVTLLKKLHQSFQHAEEPTQRRQSFASLASQCGRAMAALHHALLWGLGRPSPAPHALYFSVFAALVQATPYRRCPRARGALGEVLGGSLLRDTLLRGSGAAFSTAAAFLAEVLRTESLEPIVRAQFVDEAGGAALRGALLAHATRRAEVWRCVTQLARLYPEFVGAHFAALMDASRACAESRESDAALADCLRAWLHYMGYVWESFDGRASDPAARPERTAHRAAAAEREVIVATLVAPALSRPAVLIAPSEEDRAACVAAEVHCIAMRCVAQAGDQCLSGVDDSTREALVTRVMDSTGAWGSAVRAEAFTTIGVWAWQYDAFAQWLPEFVDRAVSALCEDTEPSVRFKAAFALSNITSRLKERREDCPLRNSPRHIQLLCNTAMHAARASGDVAVVGHGIRMMSHLLESLTVDELIGELSDEQMGVAEGYFTALLRFLLPSNRDAKLRWNAACALGLGLSREETFEADPKLAIQAVERLCVIVCHDRIYKVRTQAAGALAKVPMRCLAPGCYAQEDLTPKLARALCNALQASQGSTDSFAQYKEQGSLSAALRNALDVVIMGAPLSEALQRVFAEYRTLLEENGLL